MAIIVVEHMEEEVFEWNICEYRHLIELIGADNVLITNVSNAQAARHFPSEWQHIFKPTPANQLFDASLVCLLDERAEQTLAPEDSQQFKYFLLGGILGNVDEFDQDRTSALRAFGYATRSIGNVQMTLDTAAICTNLIVNGKRTFESLSFIDRPELRISTNESLVIPFRFLAAPNGDHPLIAPGIVEILQKDDEFF